MWIFLMKKTKFKLNMMMGNLRGLENLIYTKKILKWAKWRSINMNYPIILFHKKLAPKLLKLRKQMEIKFSYKTKRKKGKKVGKSPSLKKEIIKKNNTKLTLSRRMTSKWNMVPTDLNLVITTNKLNWLSMANGNTNCKKNKLRINLIK